MCTAIAYKTKDFYLGRTLDHTASYGENVCVTPRNFALDFLKEGSMPHHYAIIGMASIPNGYPLYYDGMNEKGLCMAGLNFVGNARYFPESEGKINLAQFEFIPYVLAKYSSVEEVKKDLPRINLINYTYNGMPPAQLHWIIADKESAITVEYTKNGTKIYENKVGVMTNNPPFDEQLINLEKYSGLSADDVKDVYTDDPESGCYTHGTGAIGLPGDLTSPSRFVRAAFIKQNTVSGNGESESVSRFFHILGSIEQPKGACRTKDGYLMTVYSSCMNADKGIYYYTTYENRCITGVDMHKRDLDGSEIFAHPVKREETIIMI